MGTMCESTDDCRKSTTGLDKGTLLECKGIPHLFVLFLWPILLILEFLFMGNWTYVDVAFPGQLF